MRIIKKKKLMNQWTKYEKKLTTRIDDQWKYEKIEKKGLKI